MNTPIDEATTMLPFTAPEDPEPGQVITLPKGRIAGGATVLNVFHQTKLVGTASRLLPILNVAKKYNLERFSSSVPIKRNTLLRIRALQFSFTTIEFIEFLGWVGTETAPNPLTLSDKHYKVLAAVPVGPQGDHFFLYEKVCLQVIEPKKGDNNGRTTHTAKT